MTPDRALFMLFAVGALILVGSSVIARKRRGEPVWRSAITWAVVFAAAFTIARWYDGR